MSAKEDEKLGVKSPLFACLVALISSLAGINWVCFSFLRSFFASRFLLVGVVLGLFCKK
jgi:hypothetical protein